VTRVAFRFEGEDYEAVLTPAGILMDPDPLVPWMRRQADRVRQLIAAGRVVEAHGAAESLEAASKAASPDADLLVSIHEALREADRGMAEEARRRLDSSRFSPCLIALFALAGVIVLVMAALKLYLVRRRRAQPVP